NTRQLLRDRRAFIFNHPGHLASQKNIRRGDRGREHLRESDSRRAGAEDRGGNENRGGGGSSGAGKSFKRGAGRDKAAALVRAAAVMVVGSTRAEQSALQHPRCREAGGEVGP